MPLALACCLAAVGGAHGQDGADWPQWRGPERDGRSAAPGPVTWPTGLARAWRVEVGIGHSSPIVVGDRAYQLARRDGVEGVAALRLADGAEVWWSGHPAPYRMNPAATAHGEGPKATPVVADGVLFTLGITGVLSALDAEDGDVLWRRDFIDEFPDTSPLYGAAASPLVVGQLVVTAIGGPGRGALRAFDRTTGATVWSSDGDGPAYASPVVGVFDGVSQILTQTEARLIALDALTGADLWSLPFRTDYDQNVVTPVLHGESVIVGGLDQGVFAVRPARDAGGGWNAPEVWRTGEVSTYMSTPVVAGGRLFGFSHRRAGQLFALDADTGATVWTSRGRDGDSAAIVSLGDHVLFLTDDATLRVMPVDADTYAPRATYPVADSPTWAHPVPVVGGILVKDRDGLALWRWGDAVP